MRIAYHPSFPGFDPAGESSEPDFVFLGSDDADELARLARDSEALLMLGTDYTQALARRLAEPGSRLRLIQFLSAGYEGAEFFGVPADAILCNGSAIWAPLVAEHAVALMLGLLRRVPELERHRQGRLWDRDALNAKLRSLDGARVGILGYGTIGQEVARRILPFGAEVVGIARSGRTCPHAARVVAMSALPDLLPTLDILLNAVPAGPATQGLVDARMLSRLRPTALFVNVGRGATVDEAALTDSLRQNRIAGAALDVFATEPLPADSPLWTLESVILSPHCAGYGSTGLARRAHELCHHNLVALRDGGPLRGRVSL